MDLRFCAVMVRPSIQPSSPTSIFCGKPIPGTANCRELGE
jgi:hypothetical protein